MSSGDWLLVRKNAGPKAQSNGVYPVPAQALPEVEEIKERVADQDARLEAICKEIEDSFSTVGIAGGRRIAVATASKYGITFRELISRSRDPLFVRARQEASFLMKKYAFLSHRQIGKVLGRRDHSTITYAINRYKKLTGEE